MWDVIKSLPLIEVEFGFWAEEEKNITCRNCSYTFPFLIISDIRCSFLNLGDYLIFTVKKA